VDERSLMEIVCTIAPAPVEASNDKKESSCGFVLFANCEDDDSKCLFPSAFSASCVSSEGAMSYRDALLTRPSAPIVNKALPSTADAKKSGLSVLSLARSQYENGGLHSWKHMCHADGLLHVVVLQIAMTTFVHPGLFVRGKITMLKKTLSSGARALTKTFCMNMQAMATLRH
jgi:hypothetical protein